MGMEFMIMVERLKLTSSWLKENGTWLITCGECSRRLTQKEFDEHIEACLILQNGR